MSKKAVFLDRDGTLIEDCGYISDCSQVKLLPGVEDALAILKMLEFQLIIISNQSGIGRGLITKKQVEEINKYLTDMLAAKGIFLTDIFYCPHLPNDKCTCRKPETGLISLAVDKYDISSKDSYFIGDKWTDVETGINAGIKSVLISSNSNDIDNSSVLIVDSLLTLAKII